MTTPEPHVDPRRAEKAAADLARGEGRMTWSLRALRAGPVLLVVALAMALVDYGGKDKTLLSALTLCVCFVATFCALAGLFGVALARETPGVRATPSWVAGCGVGTILGSFAVGLFGVLT